MPLYEFQCFECGLKFEKFAKAKDQEKECQCGSMAKRQQTGSFSFSFNQTIRDPVPQNTGVASIDHHIDRVIGKSAEMSWAAIESRNSDKREVMRDYQLDSKHAIGIDPEGHYRPITSQEIQASTVARNLNNKAMDVIKRVPKEEREKRVHIKKVD